MRKKDRIDRAIMSMLLDPMRLEKVSEAMEKTDGSPVQGIVDRAATTLGTDHACFTLLGYETAMIVAAYDRCPYELPVLSTYCFYTGGGEPFRVTDAKTHPLVCDLKATRGIGSYLGMPVTFAGFVLGALCVWNALPRDWSDAEAASLTTLAAELTEWWTT
jgi:GAF domain-containing protein